VHRFRAEGYGNILRDRVAERSISRVISIKGVSRSFVDGRVPVRCCKRIGPGRRD